LGHTLSSTFDEDFIGLELFSSLAFTALTRMTGERDLYPVLLLQTNSVLAAGTDERRMVLSRDLEDFRSLVRLRCIY